MVMRRLFGALCAALLISGAFTLLLARKLSKPRQTAAFVQYTAAVRDLEAGEVLTTADLAQVNWPATAPVNGAASTSAEVVGRALLSPLSKGQPVLTRQLSAVGGLGLSARVPNGLRAISLRSDQVVGVAGFLLPGTRIDVLVTYRAMGTADSITATVMQNAEILATGQKTQPDPEGKPSTTDVVTLLVSPVEAERLVLASTQGTLHFVLRNGADTQAYLPKPIDLAALGLHAAPAPSEAAVAPPKATSHHALKVVAHAAPAPAPYSITVVRGDKQTVETF